MLRGAQRDPRELAQLVGLLVGQPAAAEHRHGVRARALARIAAQPVGDEVERARPSVAGSSSPSHRGPAGVVSRSGALQDRGGGPALLAQPAAVGREVAAVDRDACRRPGGERLGALQRAVRAVRRDRRSCHRCYTRRRRGSGRRRAAGAGTRHRSRRSHDHVGADEDPQRGHEGAEGRLGQAKPRGTRKPPYAPTAPAMIRCSRPPPSARPPAPSGPSAPAPEDGRDHPVGRAVADPGADEQDQERGEEEPEAVLAAATQIAPRAPAAMIPKRRQRDARAADPVGERSRRADGPAHRRGHR